MADPKLSEQMAWDIYFSALAAMCLHPGNLDKFDASEAAMFADDMLEERRRRFWILCGSWVTVQLVP